MEKHYENLYATIIYPALYGKDYEEATQQGLFDDQGLPTSEDDIDTSNKWAKEKTRFKPGNEYRFKKDVNDEVEGQRKFDLDSLVDNETEETSTMDAV